MERAIPVLLLCSIFLLVSDGYAQTVADQKVCKECPKAVQLSKVKGDQKIDSLQYQQFDKKENYWNTVLTTTFEYNKAQQPVKETNTYKKDHAENYRNGGISGKSRHIYTYNKSGRLLTDEFIYEEQVENQITVAEDNTQPEVLNPVPGKPKVKGSYKEDEYGRAYVIPAHKEEGSYKILYTYNKKGVLTSVLYQTKNGTGFKDYSKAIYAYAPKGRLLSERLFFIEPVKATWKLYKEEKHTYDTKGAKTCTLLKTIYDPTGQNPYLCIPAQHQYTYNSSGLVVKEVHLQFIDSTWEEYEQIITTNVKTYTYEILRQAADGGVWYHAALIRNLTDTNENIINSLILEPQSEEWVTLSLQTYSYDKDSNRLSYQEEPLKEPEFTDSFRCQYFYSKK